MRQCLGRCPKCPGKNPVIAPDGPTDCGLMFVGEAPGREENNKGRPFIGNTGREFNELYLPLAGLNRNRVYLTNTVKCYPGQNEKVTDDLVLSCAEYHLLREIRTVNPRLIVPMGAVASSLIPEIDLEMHHGMPIEVNYLGRNVTAFPMWHPASGLHDTARMLPLQNDFRNLGLYLSGQLETPVDEYPDVDYRMLESKDDFYEATSSNELDPLTTDTEALPSKKTKSGWEMWCLTFSQLDGTGYMIRNDNQKLIRMYNQFVNRYHRGPFVFHNYMFDGPIMMEAGIAIPNWRVDDTMVRAYHIGTVPQSLKALAWRLCGMVMQEFEDLVLPYAVDLVIDYMFRLSSVDFPKPRPEIQLKNGEFVEYKPQGLNTKVKRFLTDFSKNPKMKVFQRWDNWSDQEKLMAMEKFGPLPRPQIDLVPMEKVIRYACRDADATLRVWKVLRQMLLDFKLGRNRRTLQQPAPVVRMIGEATVL